jgi:prefoldin subunit 5
MIKLGEIQEAESKVLADIGQLLAAVRALSETAESLSDGATRLRQIRTTIYENLNQIHHEHLVIQALVWLQANGFAGPSIEWY